MRTNGCFLFIFVFLLIMTLHVDAQHELWGMVSEGGGNTKGAIFKTDSSGNNYSIDFSFDNFERNSYKSLIKATNGKYYGVSYYGGSFGLGVLFEYDRNTDSVRVLHDFDGSSSGANPAGNLMQSSNGKLYGMTVYGGNVLTGLGILYEYDISGATFTKLHDFDGASTGRNPFGSLIELAEGKLLGMTTQGGAYSYGTIFEYDLTAGSLTKKYDLGAGNGGRYPQGAFLEANNGKFYAVTSGGGTAGFGVLFEYDTTAGTVTILHDFGPSTGTSPRATLIQAQNGKLYGTTNAGGLGLGVLFEYDISLDTVIARHLFTGSATGSGPEYNALLEGIPGTLLGMTRKGGSFNNGVIYKFNYSTGVLAKEYDFPGAPGGKEPYGSLVESVSGQYLGMTYSGGSAGKGLIFEFDTAASTLSVKHSFDSYSRGQLPYGALTAASNGKFYGMTKEGGIYNLGVIFEFDPLENSIRKLHDFNGASTGSRPNGSLLEATDGKLYGMTYQGGLANYGVLFEFDIQTGVFTKRHDFSGFTGANPYGSLIRASNGKLYGLTSAGGNFNYGVLFEYNINTNTYTAKQWFVSAVNGRNPLGDLLEASNGKLYGLTELGGANDHGVLFEYDITADVIVKLFDFQDATSGRNPRGSLVEASTNGKLYGLTYQGGSSSAGTIFSYDISADTLIRAHNFSSASTGQNPYGSLTESSNGKFYGMTFRGGSNDQGVIFEFDTVGTVIKKLDFNGTNGKYPRYAKLIKVFVNATWTGAVSANWHDPANWLQNDIPCAFTAVTIPDVTGTGGSFPVVSANGRAQSITIDPGADIDVLNGFLLKVGIEE